MCEHQCTSYVRTVCTGVQILLAVLDYLIVVQIFICGVVAVIRTLAHIIKLFPEKSIKVDALELKCTCN